MANIRFSATVTRGSSNRARHIARALAGCFLLFPGLAPAPPPQSLAEAEPCSWIRINQLGYLPTGIKVAVFVTEDSVALPAEFFLRDRLTGDIVWRSRAVRCFGPYGPFAAAARLDFSPFTGMGAFTIHAGDVFSPPVRIGWDVYQGSTDVLLRYLRQQRCGYNPYLRDSCHTRDGYRVYHPFGDSAYVDVVGGWHDASDYLRYVTTSATAVTQLLAAYERFPAVFGDDFGASGLPGADGLPDVLNEAIWGLRWLLRMNPGDGIMYNQVADDRDHRGFRLPTEDTVDYGRGTERPVYYCTGEPQGIFEYRNRTTGIASTAAKFASAFALGSLVLNNRDSSFAGTLASRAESAYDLARSRPGVCQTAPCRAPYFYEEENWVDDMELAAAMLFRLTGRPVYREQALEYARLEPVTPWLGASTARHYQWYPFVNIGHAELVRPGNGEVIGQVLSFMRDGIGRVAERGRDTPFLYGIPFIWCSSNLTASFLVQLRLYATAASDSGFGELEAAYCDWLFGCNPWGTSMVVGYPVDGVAPRDPHSAFTHVHGYPITGGLVDGPVAASVFERLKGLRLTKPDVFGAFQSDLAVYHDDWGDYSTNEPTLDGTASLIFALAAQEDDGRAGEGREIVRRGAVVRLDTTRREVYLVFTGHEFGEGGGEVRQVLRRHSAPASFFFTGDFYRNPAFAALIRGLRSDGHYLGPHSDRHLLYASWEDPDSLLVDRGTFERDLLDNYAAMVPFGILPGEARLFVPPFEWTTDKTSAWARALGVRPLTFTSGTRTNADYTVPEMGDRYLSSGDIVRNVLHVADASPSGLNGSILLMHIGVDPRRPDPLYRRLDGLLSKLRDRGFSFSKLPF